MRTKIKYTLIVSWSTHRTHLSAVAVDRGCIQGELSSGVHDEVHILHVQDIVVRLKHRLVMNVEDLQCVKEGGSINRSIDVHLVRGINRVGTSLRAFEGNTQNGAIDDPTTAGMCRSLHLYGVKALAA